MAPFPTQLATIFGRMGTVNEIQESVVTKLHNLEASVSSSLPSNVTFISLGENVQNWSPSIPPVQDWLPSVPPVQDWLPSVPPDLLNSINLWMKENWQYTLDFVGEHKEAILMVGAILALAVLGYLVPLALVGLVQMLGFGATGIVKGSLAALYQASVLGGFIAKASVFAVLQSVGALAAMPPAISITVVLLIVGTVMYLKGV